MRVLLVVQSDSWPARSGIGRRVEALHEALSCHHDVTVLACLPRSASGGSPPAGCFTRLNRPPGGIRALPRLVAAAMKGEPLTSAFYVSRRLRREVAVALRAAAPDVVVAQGLASAVLVAGTHPMSKTIVDLADAEHERVAGLGRSGGWRKAPYLADGARIARWFRQQLPRMAAVSVVSGHDLESYRSLAPTARLLLCPNGSSVPPAPRHDPRSRRLLFLGDLEYAPNASGLRWFVSEVLPHLADVELRVVGRGSAPTAPCLEHVGFVPDLTTEWRQAAALVVPLFAGGGTRLKVVEAMAAGVPVISTTMGVAGLDVRPGHHCLTADTAEGMATAVRRLLDDQDLRQSVSAAGYRLAKRKYSWNQCLLPLSDEVLRLRS